jgi:hypothetical protein
MRSIVLAWCLFACGGTGDVHALKACDQAWMANGFQQCEAACVDAQTALGAAGAACQASTSDGTPVSCSKTFVYQGVTGCCAADPPRVRFAECN